MLSRVSDVEPDAEDRIERHGATMIWTAWSSGSRRSGGCGFRIRVQDRDLAFPPGARHVTVELPGREEPLQIELSPSFWADCPEIRGAGIGDWLIGAGHAPWPRGRPPRFVVESLGEARFHLLGD